MNEQIGQLRPVKQRENAEGTAVRYAVEPIGDVTASVRYAEIEDLGIVQVLDETRLTFTDDADGFALYDQGGTLLAWWQLIAPPGDELSLPAGWGFKAHVAADATKAERAETVSR